MTLIKSISGIRGTIGGKTGETLSPNDVVKFVSAFGFWLKSKSAQNHVVIGRDARPSGETISKLVAATLQSLGLNVIDLGLSTTPTVEIAVPLEKAAGGIIITASHNPIQWNALKLLNEKGEFISAADGEEVLALAESEEVYYVEPKKQGYYSFRDDGYIPKHIEMILELPLVDVDAIKSSNFRIAIDCVNSTGGIAVPMLLKKLGVTRVTNYFCEPNGLFPHNPEPIPENLNFICKEIENGHFDLGIVVDPDVDRLALICEDGTPFGEEYTLVSVADYVLKNNTGNTVSNLSSSRALQDVTEKNGGEYFFSAVGEVNVVEAMKEYNAVIGGEGNGGVIYPDLHYGRDALVGIALFLSHLAKSGKSMRRLKSTYPEYHISKNKIELDTSVDIDSLLKKIKFKYNNNPITTIDGVKVIFGKEWVHLRKSNTEPIIRIYAESDSPVTANHLATKLIMDIRELLASHGN
jgi:phosphomannomutase